ncbi:MAG: glutamate mutase L [Candidatus Bathyarchaeota archaeon]|nr:glutamate mutase L [Candidatus Bathyarchaeota archaeon]
MANLKKSKEKMKYCLVSDVGSTTTKVRFFHRRDGEWRFLIAGEAPTTVEAPFENVTLGVRNAVREVEEQTGHRILSEDGSGIIIPCNDGVGVDLYCTTSSAGGGLQMMVAGLTKLITAESANRTALGAGAIVMDVIAQDDGRKPYEKIKRIRELRPDMILLAGGADGGASNLVMEIAELITAAEPRARLGINYDLPLIYAGNKELRPQITNLMGKKFSLSIVDNIRPVLDIEDTEPARRATHELFMVHVMSHAPGYDTLMKWTDIDIMPTPGAEGLAMQLIASSYNKNVIGVGLGGATTNIYSIVEGRFVRSVSANLGMSYSIANVMKETGIENIIRWIPFEISINELKKRLYNKMIRPTTIPQTIEDLIIEHATAREALRLGLKHHKSIATRLKGVHKQRTAGEIFDQLDEETYIKMMDINIITGTGGLLSHAPRRSQSLLILIDAFQPEGVTWLFQDSVFMMPHLGILSTVYKEAALQIFEKDCLTRLGTVIAPKGYEKDGKPVMTIKLEISEGNIIEEKINFGEIKRISLPEGETFKVYIKPEKRFDVGSGSGHMHEATIMGGKVGLVLDARGRPFKMPEDEQIIKESLFKWFNSMDLYPSDLPTKLKTTK